MTNVHSITVCGAGLLIVALVGCSDSPTRPEPEPDPPVADCALVELGSAPQAASLSAAQLRAALADAGTRLVSGLGESAATNELRTKLQSLPAALSGSDSEATCQAFNAAVDALEGWSVENPPGSAARPDFALIRQTLGVVEVSLRGL